MSDFIDAGSIADLPLGRAKAVSAGEKKIAVFHTPNGFFALDNTCPHRGGPLAEGDIILANGDFSKDEIICPWHLWGFELATGLCPGNPEIAVATHEVRIDGDHILVKP